LASAASITITDPSPSPGNDTTPTWKWSVTNKGWFAQYRYVVDISRDGGAYSAASPPTVTSQSWTPNSGLSDGQYKIRVTAEGRNWFIVWLPWEEDGQAESRVYWLDTQVPGPVGTIHVPVPNPGKVNRPVWSWTAADPGAGAPIVSYNVELSTDGSSWQAAAPPSVGAPVVAWSPNYDLSDGQYWIRVKAVDGSGYQSASWAVAGSPYQLDATKPVIDAGTWDPSNDSWIGTNTYTVKVNITDPMGEGGSYKSGVKQSTLSASISPGATIGSRSWSGDTVSIPISNLANGTEYTLTVNVQDNAGNGAEEKQLKFKVDLLGPTFTEAFPADGFETNEKSIRPYIKISDAESGVDPDSIAWTMTDPGSSAVSGESTWDDVDLSTFIPGTVANPVDLSKNGYYSLRVYAEDEVDHVSNYPPSGTWRFLLDTVDPKVDLVELVDAYRQIPDATGAIYTPVNTPTVRVTVSDPSPGSGFNGGSSEASGTLNVYVYQDEGMTQPVDGALSATGRPTTNNGVWTETWAPSAALLDGDYYVKVVVTDDAGNTRTSETYDFMFIVDTKSPDITDKKSEVGFMNTSNERRFANTNMIEVTWNSTPDPDTEQGVPGSGLRGYEFEIWTKADGDETPTGSMIFMDYWYSDGFNGTSFYFVPPTGSDTEVWSAYYSLPFESGKSYGAWIRAWDMVHNASAWFDPPFIFDPDAPTDPADMDVASFVSGRRTNDNTPTLQWTHSTDGKPGLAQSGVDLYEVQVTKAATSVWDIHYEIDIPDEDVDLALPTDEPLSGTFVWSLPAPLADGSWEVRVRAKDVAGNYSNWAVISAPFEIDATAPAVPGMPALKAPEASPTKNTMPTWTWTAVTDADFNHYNVYADGVLVGSETSNEYTSTGLGHGMHVLEVTAVDDLGNESAKSTQGHVMIDLMPPTAPEMDPVPTWSKRGKIRFTWSASSDDTAVKYNFEYSLDGGATWMLVPGLAGQSQIVDASALAHGTVVAGRVTAYDEVGNESISGVVSTTIDDEKPVASADTTPAARSNEARPTWKWSATDVGSGVDYFVVTLDGELPIQTSGTSFTPAAKLSDGTHVLKVKAVDKVGNVSDEVAFDEIVIDTTPPAVPGMPALKAPEKSPTKNVQPGWTWELSPGAVAYNVYLDGEATPSVTVAEPDPGDDMLFVYPADLAEGIHHLQVTALDDLGNESAKSGTGHVVIDTTGPLAPAAPRTTSPTTSNRQLWVWDYVEDGATFEVQKSVHTEGDDWSWSDPIPVGNSLTYETDYTGDGVTRYLRVRAYDALGNVGYLDDEVWKDGWSEAGSVIVDTEKPEPPTDLEIDPDDLVKDSEGNPVVPSLTTEKQPTWTWAASTSTDVASYEVSLDGAAAVNIGLPATLEYTPAPLADGKHALKVRAIDERGNASGWVGPVEVEVDTTVAKPNAPVPTKNPTNEIPVWTWAAVTDLHGPVTYNVYFDGASEPVASGLTTTTWKPDAIPTPDGTHYLQIEAVDGLGNVSPMSERGEVVIDTTPPAVPAMKALPPFTKNATLTFEWSASDTAVKYDLSYSKNGGTNWTEVPNLTAQSYTLGIADVADGIAVLGKVRAWDGVGNVSVYSDAVQTIIDRTGPVVEITNPTEEVTTNAVKFTYGWTAKDAGCGVDYCTVVLNGSEHRVEIPTKIDTEDGILVYTYAWTGTLIEGDNSFKVWATDKLGNRCEVAAVALLVTQAKPQIVLVQPMPGAEYKINEISTIAFQVIGLIDAVPEALLNGTPLDAWRMITVASSREMAKFYVLLDSDVMVPGTMGIRITVGAGSELFIYTVDSERSGFGFGRLRPW